MRTMDFHFGGDDVLLRCGACVRTTWTWPQKNRQHRPCCRTPRPAVPVARRLSGFVRLTRSPADARSPARRPPRPRGAASGAAPRVRFSTGLDPGGGPDLAPLDRTSGRGARLTADRSGRWRSREGRRRAARDACVRLYALPRFRPPEAGSRPCIGTVILA